LDDFSGSEHEKRSTNEEVLAWRLLYFTLEAQGMGWWLDFMCTFHYFSVFFVILKDTYYKVFINGYSYLFIHGHC
jgi:hypothetical protein